MFQTRSNQDAVGYEIRFQSLFRDGKAIAFPCDAGGHVNIDALSEHAKENYLFARAMIGREYGMPEVQVDALLMTGRVS
jgi:hypothetical protein